MHVPCQRGPLNFNSALCVIDDLLFKVDRKRSNLLDSCHNLFPLLLATPNKQMPWLLPTTLNPHKLVELQNPPLAACPTFTSLVKQCLARVMHALILSRNRGGLVAPSTAADGVWCHRQSRVVRFGVGWRGWFRMCLGSLIMVRNYGNSMSGSRAIRNAIPKRRFY